MPDLTDNTPVSNPAEIVFIDGAVVNQQNADVQDLLNSIDPSIPVHYIDLSSDGMAQIATKVDNDLVPLKAWYHISAEVENKAGIAIASRGTLLTNGEPESLALRFWRRAVHVVLREVFI